MPKKAEVAEEVEEEEQDIQRLFVRGLVACADFVIQKKKVKAVEDEHIIKLNCNSLLYRSLHSPKTNSRDAILELASFSA